MFGIGKILGFVKMVAPYLQFVPALAPFATLFNIADQISSLVGKFKSGFSFLDLVSKFAPLPKIFGQTRFAGNFGLNPSKISSWQSTFAVSSKEYQAFKLVKESVNNWNQVNTARTSTNYCGNFRLSSGK